MVPASADQAAPHFSSPVLTLGWPAPAAHLVGIPPSCPNCLCSWLLHSAHLMQPHLALLVFPEHSQIRLAKNSAW